MNHVRHTKMTRTIMGLQNGRDVILTSVHIDSAWLGSERIDAGEDHNENTVSMPRPRFCSPSQSMNIAARLPEEEGDDLQSKVRAAIAGTPFPISWSQAPTLDETGAIVKNRVFLFCWRAHTRRLPAYPAVHFGTAVLEDLM